MNAEKTWATYQLEDAKFDKQQTLDQQWKQYKDLELLYQTKRREVEKLILTSGEKFKNLKWTAPKYQTWDLDKLPEDFKQQYFKVKLEPNNVLLKALQEVKPELYNQMAQHLTIKEGNPTFSWKGE